MTEEKNIRVLITDDHAVVRNGLSSFLMAFDDFELVGEAKNGEQAVRLCDQFLPDVVLMDLVMPGMDGASATRLIREKHPNIQIIALTSFKEREQVQAVIQAGAIGYLLKDISADELARAIRLAYEGKPTLAPEAAEVLIQAVNQPEVTIGSDLTDREREVLLLMVEGFNNQQIAERLFVSLSTAKSHVSSVLSKLGVTTRTEAVSFALKNRLV
ncbi:MAG: response regulator transcription factor [Anaerolineaceae bacterium]|jgi:NarL family two-component system response regulator LiaR|nr:response regulator transcription factor [Anaerolineaceae bacterium]